ncbi:MAG: lytic transglycosylase domain-containing protein [Desulfovibrionaceae bacterium]|nr:lytic transglycosylase domain-containing protein [Desulfovibrionaceae bacterium]
MADVRTSKRPGFALRESSDVPNKDLTLQLIPPPPKPLDSSGNVFRPWIPRRASLPLREWVDIIVDAGHAYGLDPVFIAAMIKAESNFDHKAVSHAGARGAMQIMPGTQKQLGLSEPFDARANVYAGCKFIRSLLLKFNSTELALAAYNAGPFAVKKAHGIPPFKETQHYVRRVMRLWQGI